MKTKVGDWVRICLVGYASENHRKPTAACISKNKYKVRAVFPEGCISVVGPWKTRFLVTSWIRCADMTEDAR